MKKRLVRLAVVLAVTCGAITVLEIFSLHPSLSVGDFHAYWRGFRQMDLTTGSGTARLKDGRTEIRKDYGIGPVQVDIVHLK